MTASYPFTLGDVARLLFGVTLSPELAGRPIATR